MHVQDFWVTGLKVWKFCAANKEDTPEDLVVHILLVRESLLHCRRPFPPPLTLPHAHRALVEKYHRGPCWTHEVISRVIDADKRSRFLKG
jgi:hypothetical protein